MARHIIGPQNMEEKKIPTSDRDTILEEEEEEEERKKEEVEVLYSLYRVPFPFLSQSN